jgi:AcrR family transcriptional regulator
VRRTAADAAETRRRLVDAATAALAERGYDGATFEHIASRIGMTRGAVHHHFRGGKDELVGAVLAEQWARYGETLLAPLGAAGASTAERLETFLAGYLAQLTGDPLFRALVTVTNLVAPLAAERVGSVAEHGRALDEWRSALHTQLGSSQARLRPGVTPEAAVFVLLAVVQGANNTAALEPDQLPDGDGARRAVVGAVVSGLLTTAPG